MIIWMVYTESSVCCEVLIQKLYTGFQTSGMTAEVYICKMFFLTLDLCAFLLHDIVSNAEPL